MAASLTLIVLLAAALILIYRLNTWHRHARPAVAGVPRMTLTQPRPQRIVGLNVQARRPAAAVGMPWGTGLTKAQAEDMLDWLEGHGRSGQVKYVAGEGFTIR